MLRKYYVKVSLSSVKEGVAIAAKMDEWAVTDSLFMILLNVDAIPRKQPFKIRQIVNCNCLGNGGIIHVFRNAHII